MLVGLAVAVGALAPQAGAAVPVKDPHAIACPQAPAGWIHPASGKTVESPQINQNIATLGASDQVEVGCDYFHGVTQHILVTVNFAVADDVNPQADFYWGCSSAGTPWNPSDRTFRVMSRQQWAIAAFSDVGGTLTDAQVPAFEQITRRLLQNAEGYGHPCTLSSSPTTVLSNFHYTFQVAAGSGEGAFWVDEPSRPKGPVQVQRVNGVTFTLHVASSGPKRRLSVQVVRGYEFQVAQPGVPGQVKLGVRVVGSALPGCTRGNTGTLTVSTKPFVRLSVCGKTFLHGWAHTQIEFWY
ncbi:MAG: hypothetical protein JO064_03480 [Actinobacteria bacterium]|nr:hypothetical protein [Actinomycetota bacterium]MBV8395301.1 hypothetical protein [Actinomycetota bacterium]